MDELIKNLPHSELKFIEDNREQAKGWPDQREIHFQGLWKERVI